MGAHSHKKASRPAENEADLHEKTSGSAEKTVGPLKKIANPLEKLAVLLKNVADPLQMQQTRYKCSGPATYVADPLQR